MDGGIAVRAPEHPAGEILPWPRLPHRSLTNRKPRFDRLSLIPQSACEGLITMTPFPAPQPWEAPDPLPVMRRELKLLLIELNVLRVEVEQLRAMRGEAHAREAFLSASVQQLTESGDQWRREAERLYALIEQMPPWSLFWHRLMDAFRAWRNSTDQPWYCA
jgi:hypothetical protein